MNNVAELLAAITVTDEAADLAPHLYEVIEGASEADGTPQAFEAAFHLVERYPLCDFGSPGPLVHWIEKHFPRYVALLEQSVCRRPTEYTLWMVNRILNAHVEAGQRRSLVAAVESAAARTDVEVLTIEAANECLAMHGGYRTFNHSNNGHVGNSPDR